MFVAIIAARWVREQGRLVKREPTSDNEMANNEASRVDQLEAAMKLMTEQMQTLTAAMTKNAAPQATEAEPSTRGRAEPRNRVIEDILNLDDDDDMTDYAARRVADSQAELQ